MSDAINAATVTAALERMLLESPDLSGVTVTRSESLNTDSSMTPWIGVYKLRQSYELSTLGRGMASRRCSVDLLVVCQYSDGSAGTNAEDGLDQLVQKVLKVILDDETLQVGVATRNLQVQYADVRSEDGVYFQEAAVLLSLMV